MSGLLQYSKVYQVRYEVAGCNSNNHTDCKVIKKLLHYSYSKARIASQPFLPPIFDNQTTNWSQLGHNPVAVNMSSLFKIEEHVLDCQHIREYARATSTSQEDVLKLSIKQYTPLENLKPKDGDVTIIGAHANGFPKVSRRLRI